MPTIITDGAASAQGYGFAARTAAANYIEDVFSTYLYTGNSATQTITNGIDLSTKGGMVWAKRRDAAANHVINDTARGASQTIYPNLTNAQQNDSPNGISFNTNGFTVGGLSSINTNTAPNVSWTFRKQAKFFDVVTYTGNATARTISHNLGSAPGCIIVKRTSALDDWYVYHRSLTSAAYSLILNTTGGQTFDTFTWNNTAPTSTSFSVGGVGAATNVSGATYVAYLFAHDAGGFGAAGTDNVISCGSFTTGGTGAATVTLGYEPQWVMIKQTDAANNWIILDTMRGWATGNNDDMRLNPNLSVAESSDELGFPTATGFQASGFGLNQTWIYIAIRRGPMKTPTSGTSVFSAKTYVGTTTSAEVTHDVTFDAEISANRGTVVNKYLFVDSLRGINGSVIQSSSTATEIAYPTYWSRKSQRTMYAPSAFDDWWSAISTNQNHISYGLVRAPGFFDEVCYTGNAGNLTLNHNLTVAPELLIAKSRSQTAGWGVYYNFGASTYNFAWLNLTNAGQGPYSYGPSVGADLASKPTASTFSWSGSSFNALSQTYVAYLFATCPGVSKVGSYTGSGTTKQIDCGFTGGARFVLIKRTDSTGDWYVWDSARGIVAGNDPYLLLNSTAAEVTGTDYVDTYSAGFEISSTAPAAINANGGSFIFLAIA